MAKRQLKEFQPEAGFSPLGAGDKDTLIVEGLRQNNLKDLDLRIPHNRITAVVGPSGSGKSSLAFDTLFAEGRWRFIESLSTYTRLFLERMDRPDLDTIRNVRPAIAVEQKNPVRTSRSTVGTATEINDYLRLLFSRVGVLHCPECGGEVKACEPACAADRLISGSGGTAATIGFTVKRENRTFEEVAEDLLKRGFVRVKVRKKIYDLNLERPKGTRQKTIDVVVDRLVLRDSDRGRLVDSLETSYREGGGAAWALFQDGSVERFSNKPVCVACGITVARPTPLALSFNHPVGACPECKGFGNVLKYDMDRIIPDKGLSLADGAIDPWTKPSYSWWYDELESYAGDYDINLDRPYEELSKREKGLISEGTADFEGIDGFFSRLERKKYKLHIKVFTSRYKSQFMCGGCNGMRLKKEALAVRVGGVDIAGVNRMTIADAGVFFKGLKLNAREREAAREVLRQITMKLKFLLNTGLGYITLDRLTKTLSGGEAQRVQIASQLASSLTGVLYILDEPSVGLHPVDIDMLTAQIKKLASRGNTVVVVEHDPSIIKASEHIIELGPGAGAQGGRLVYSGGSEAFIKEAQTLTADYLTGRAVIHVPRWRRKGDGRSISLKGASGNNLKDVDVNIPLQTLTCVTGVSGSGKSTLVVDTLYRTLASHFSRRPEGALPFREVWGVDAIKGVKLIDQAPIGRTPRSIPVTYTGAFDHIRKLFSRCLRARSAGLTQGHFSFNIPGGRCEACRGEGMERLEMYFLPDVYIKCGACGGRRYKPQVLDVKYRGRNISDILDMTFDDAFQLFAGEDELLGKFSVVTDVGLGYLRLGQSALTLSGGEAQRLKVARELIDRVSDNMLYIFDEPTTGLHMDDTKRLLSVLGRLVDSRNTVLVIEHNIDLVKTADYVIDLGPGGGDRGGRVVGAGTPEELAGIKKSRTGAYLKKALAG